jgi:hypothetical protein
LLLYLFIFIFFFSFYFFVCFSVVQLTKNLCEIVHLLYVSSQCLYQSQQSEIENWLQISKQLKNIQFISVTTLICHLVDIGPLLICMIDECIIKRNDNNKINNSFLLRIQQLIKTKIINENTIQDTIDHSSILTNNLTNCIEQLNYLKEQQKKLCIKIDAHTKYETKLNRKIHIQLRKAEVEVNKKKIKYIQYRFF